MKKTFLLLTLFLAFIALHAQNEKASTNNSGMQSDDWYNYSPVDDQIYGAEVNKAYNLLLKDKKSTQVIVAVIDGGVDITHEDLKDNIWVNQDEIPDNGMDDDQNGYIDDIHGWNFLGNSKGENIAHENLEITRIYKRYKDKFSNVKISQLSDKEKEEYELYKEAKKRYEKSLKMANRQKEGFEKFKNRYYKTHSKITEVLQKDTITLSDLDSLKEHNKDLKKDIKFIYNFVKYSFKEDFFDEIETYVNDELDYHLNLDFNPREIIGDDVSDINTYYGNNNVYGPDADHGTFVSGIIAAKRDNAIGINGIAENVKIMALKTVPDGDERDKDVAKAIRYAADNGARIINMSFGKELSPYKYMVDAAILYAQKKGVLLVNAAGNDALDIDKVMQYPTKRIDDNTIADSWITVGANSKSFNLKFAASFTNYGNKMVDIFAPGVQIKSLAPENKYDIADGTSFSAPVVSGVAALVLSYYPDLTAAELKDIILKSANLYPETKVYKPSEGIHLFKSKTKFKKLSATGGIVSSYKALQMAEEKSK